MSVHYRDLFRAIKVQEAFPTIALTASKTDFPVIERSLFPGEVIGIVFKVTVITTGDASNFFTLKLFEADAKGSSTALTAGTEVVASDIFGTSNNGAFDAAHTPFPLIDDVAMSAGDIFFLQYAGQKDFFQPQAIETGTAAITLDGTLIAFDAYKFQNMEQ